MVTVFFFFSSAKIITVLFERLPRLVHAANLTQIKMLEILKESL